MDILQDIDKALEYTKERNFKKAEKIYLSLLKNDKDNHVILSFLGLLYINWGLYKKAEKYLEKSYALNKNQSTYENLALVKYYNCKPEVSLKFFEEIVDKTKNFKVLNKYIKLLLRLNKNSKAAEYAEKCVKMFPLKKEAQSNLAESYIHIGKLKESFNISAKLIRNYPKYANGWLWYGLVQEMLFHDDIEAEKCYKMVLKCGDKYRGYFNLSINAFKRELHKKELYYIRKYRKYEYGECSSLFGMANVYLKTKNFKKGMRYYYRHIYSEKSTEIKGTAKELKNHWKGKSHKKETLFVYGDQGIGDLIMFSRYLPFLCDKFKSIKVFLRGNLMDLFNRSFKEYKNIKFYDPEKVKRYPNYDKSAILSCIAYLMKMYYDKIPFPSGYLTADNKLVEKYKNIIVSDKLKVGICWEAGAAGWREQLNRTLNVALYEPLFDIPDIQYYSLQVNPTLDNYKNYSGLIDLGKDFKNFDDTAGAIKNLDVVVTVDTSLAHLAGAMGIKTFMLLPYCTDWRWFNDDNTTPWYDSVKIFKQKNPKSWDDVIDNIVKELKKLK